MRSSQVKTTFHGSATSNFEPIQHTVLDARHKKCLIAAKVQVSLRICLLTSFLLLFASVYSHVFRYSLRHLWNLFMHMTKNESKQEIAKFNLCIFQKRWKIYNLYSSYPISRVQIFLTFESVCLFNDLDKDLYHARRTYMLSLAVC